MPYFDLPLDELTEYLPQRTEPPDFDDFWASTLGESRELARPTELRPAFPELRALEVFDVTFSGFAGQPIRAWLLLPKHRRGRVPAVVQFVGYGGGRGLPTQWLTWPAAGYAHLVMDTRGQGSEWASGDTADVELAPSGPQHPGFLTRGILDPATYYYRRLIADAVRAVETAREHSAVDPDRIVIAGASQGGGLALAATSLVGSAAAALIDVPFLSHVRRAVEVTDEQPYLELRVFLSIHRHRADDAFRTLSYVDGMNFAARATTPALVSVGLMDEICPPSTVFAAFNHYAGPKELRVWPYNGHEAGSGAHVLEQLRFLSERGIAPAEPA